MNKDDIRAMSVDEMVTLYSDLIKVAKERGIIRTNNFIGEIGEHLAIEYYNKTPGLPNLQAAPIGTENIDAISRNGERYSIKSASGRTTGVFYGLEPKGSSNADRQKFEYAVVCSFNSNYELEAIYELEWEDFLKHKNGIRR